MKRPRREAREPDLVAIAHALAPHGPDPRPLLPPISPALARWLGRAEDADDAEGAEELDRRLMRTCDVIEAAYGPLGLRNVAPATAIRQALRMSARATALRLARAHAECSSSSSIPCDLDQELRGLLSAYGSPETVARAVASLEPAAGSGRSPLPGPEDVHQAMHCIHTVSVRDSGRERDEAAGALCGALSSTPFMRALSDRLREAIGAAFSGGQEVEPFSPRAEYIASTMSLESVVMACELVEKCCVPDAAAAPPFVRDVLDRAAARGRREAPDPLRAPGTWRFFLLRSPAESAGRILAFVGAEHVAGFARFAVTCPGDGLGGGPVKDECDVRFHALCVLLLALCDPLVPAGLSDPLAAVLRGTPGLPLAAAIERVVEYAEGAEDAEEAERYAEAGSLAARFSLPL
jgi:hypothetical protein